MVKTMKPSRIISIILSILILIPCFSITSFADSKKMNYSGGSGQVYQANVSVPKFKLSKPNQKEIITVVNKGKATVNVCMNGQTWFTLGPGKSCSLWYYTVKYGGRTISVKVQPRSNTYGTQNVIVQSSSKNNIKILGRR